MKLRNLYKINSFRGVLISVVIHGALLFLLATTTMHFTTPEGFVTDGAVEVTTISQGTSPDPGVKPEPPKGAPQVQQVVPTVKPKPLPPKETIPPIKAEPESENADQEIETVEIPTQVIKEGSEESTEADDDTKGKWVPYEEEPTTVKNELPSSDELAAQQSSEESFGTQTDGDGSLQGLPQGEVRSDKELVPLAGNRGFNYPLMSRFKREQGVVIVRYTIDTTGHVDRAWVHKSSGYKALDQEAVDRIVTWQYKPRDGKYIYQKQVTFSLKGKTEAVSNKN